MDNDLIIEATGECVGSNRLSLPFAIPSVLCTTVPVLEPCYMLSQDLQKSNGLSFKKINWTDVFII